MAFAVYRTINDQKTNTIKPLFPFAPGQEAENLLKLDL
ncbi:hypothetical protein C723_0686 [Christiangramia flava JLT2011]|uniref:Uncharacterized protein n=1 Tax=Christiangramia flava JLT2011 TaxID=1229726 RepID=A0A1L7I2P7_9FLAO|nr:hypothetical protein GRFL_1152 [Christiangramia flava JLT2011]OSS40378.1 hypothetical protein C723_0686 [Christiangramia flava JLT2011]